MHLAVVPRGSSTDRIRHSEVENASSRMINQRRSLSLSPPHFPFPISLFPFPVSLFPFPVPFPLQGFSVRILYSVLTLGCVYVHTDRCNRRTWEPCSPSARAACEWILVVGLIALQSSLGTTACVVSHYFQLVCLCDLHAMDLSSCVSPRKVLSPHNWRSEASCLLLPSGPDKS